MQTSRKEHKDILRVGLLSWWQAVLLSRLDCGLPSPCLRGMPARIRVLSMSCDHAFVIYGVNITTRRANGA